MSAHDKQPDEYPLARVVEEPAGRTVAAWDGDFARELGGEAPWKRYLAVLRRRKGLLLGVLLLGGAVGAVAAWWIDPRYQAEATLWVEWEGSRPGEAGPFRPRELLSSYDWVDLLKSYSVLEHVVVERRLFLGLDSREDGELFADFGVEGDFRPGAYALYVSEDGEAWLLETGDTLVIDRGRAGTPVGAPIGVRWSPPWELLYEGERVAFTLHNPRDVARQLEGRLGVRMLERGSLMRIELGGPDPNELAATVNAIADRFAGLAAELSDGRARDVREQLERQLGDAEGRLRGAEAELEAFRTEVAELPVQLGPGPSGAASAGNPLQEGYFAIRHELERTRRDRRALEALVRDERRLRNADALLQTIPAAKESPTLEVLLGELTARRLELREAERVYTDEHPEVVSLRADIASLEGSEIPSAIVQLANALEARETALSQELSGREAELQDLPPRATEAARLEREFRVAEEVYSMLRQRHEQVRLASESDLRDIRVLDHAVAGQRPITDDRMAILLFAMLASVGVGVAGVLGYDRFDPRIRYPDEVTRGFGLSILGTVPHLALGRKMGDEATSEAMEAFRALRLNVAYAYGAAGPVVTTITSPGPGEGKSFITLNLALSFARAGYRTLVIDGDVRRGRLHRALDVPRRPGIMDFLSGTVERDEVVRATPHRLLDVMTSGIRKQNAPELLGNERMRDLLADLKLQYQVVLVDSPPLGAGVDPLILSVASGSMLLVLRAGTSVRGTTEQQLSSLQRLPVRMLGAVLNDVPDDGAYPYYYSYLPDYRPIEEESPASRELIGA